MYSIQILQIKKGEKTDESSFYLSLKVVSISPNTNNIAV